MTRLVGTASDDVEGARRVGALRLATVRVRGPGCDRPLVEGGQGRSAADVERAGSRFAGVLVGLALIAVVAWVLFVAVVVPAAGR